MDQLRCSPHCQGSKVLFSAQPWRRWLPAVLFAKCGEGDAPPVLVGVLEEVGVADGLEELTIKKMAHVHRNQKITITAACLIGGISGST